MKVKLNIDPSQKEAELIINAPNLTPEVKQLYQLLQERQSNLEQIEAEKENVSYYLNLSDILFFETDSKVVMAHTNRNAYQVKYKLYELEDLLGGNFMRVAKSTILNLDKVYSVTRSISNCQIKFEESYKTVYVSRHYYRDLRNRLEERRNLG
ncbi:LytTR family DNA-binding domain-containing protein [Lactobacillus crispatus]|uniref:LytTR family DNA-binding domain-containing protein n=1 Tax=Lactobacillus crispatus TaxID=47770 RepID=UPI00119008E7|nr:LytTR family DNA-binding domain-containing protein [Lactobacillus crispatus]KAA8810882.1 LytTR family transcriptional regulator [Lactobacillus crispatus]MDT9604876.1 LytTR family DNA-binding domain-containing protein [Lactobacillus crispatus]MDX5062593.1 LytTR family DNA-binding domain-containing protein [Lactobacillus crispatus]MDX5074722.1 LytTR family DNA-binding domain-containing protein [Lactobacillus crispatus]MDX5078095.1 LytTR family DNA-binding domain-containing protein [Lactobacil